MSDLDKYYPDTSRNWLVKRELNNKTFMTKTSAGEDQGWVGEALNGHSVSGGAAVVYMCIIIISACCKK